MRGGRSAKEVVPVANAICGGGNGVVRLRQGYAYPGSHPGTDPGGHTGPHPHTNAATGSYAGSDAGGHTECHPHPGEDSHASTDAVSYPGANRYAHPGPCQARGHPGGSGAHYG